jgi:hypothetical protein
MKRRKHIAAREFQSCMGSLRCRAEGFATRLLEQMLARLGGARGRGTNLGETKRLGESCAERSPVIPHRQ